MLLSHLAPSDRMESGRKPDVWPRRSRPDAHIFVELYAQAPKPFQKLCMLRHMHRVSSNNVLSSHQIRWNSNE